MLEPGRVCIKTAGREAGRYCVVLKKLDENFVLVTGPKSLTKVKRRKCNIEHLEPLEYKLEIKAGAEDEEVLKAYEKAGLIEKLKLQPPKAEEKPKKAEKEAKEKKPEKPKKEKPKEKPEKKTKKPEKAEKKKTKK